MTTEEVKRLRGLAPQGAIIEVFVDNNKFYYAGPIENYAFFWDDINECFYQLRPNVSAYTQVKSPLEVSMVLYEHIQSMVFKANLTETLKFLTDRGLTPEEVNKNLANLQVINGQLLNTTNVSTSKGYADGSVPKE